MAKKPNDDQLSDTEAAQRAADALRRALTTPYKPQSKLKIGPRKKVAKNSKRQS